MGLGSSSWLETGVHTILHSVEVLRFCLFILDFLDKLQLGLNAYFGIFNCDNKIKLLKNQEINIKIFIIDIN